MAAGRGCSGSAIKSKASSLAPFLHMPGFGSPVCGGWVQGQGHGLLNEIDLELNTSSATVSMLLSISVLVS